MITNKILNYILGIISIIIIPLQIVSTLILGIFVKITFGILLLILNSIWSLLFLFPILGLSYIYEKITILRIPIALIGIPLAIVGNIYSCLIPAMGETESRVEKLLLTESFPFSWHLYQLNLNNSIIEFTKGFPILMKILNKIKVSDELRWNYIAKIKIINNLD